MRKIIQKNIITLSLAIFLLFSFSYLFSIEKKQHNLDYKKDWWAVYFENPTGNSLNFALENHSDETTFKWEVYLEKSKTYSGDFNLSKGEKKIIPINTTALTDKKITIRVTNNNQTKEIYKIITSD